MFKTKTLSLSNFIAKEAQKLDEERRKFFLLWLADHADIGKPIEDQQLEKKLNDWFYSLSIGQVL